MAWKPILLKALKWPSPNKEKIVMQEKVVIEQLGVPANQPSTPSATAETLSTLALLGPAPLLEGEDSNAYNELLTRISAKVAPTDVLEEIWVRDVVDYTWEAFRWRRLKTRLITSTEDRGISAVLVSRAAGSTDEIMSANFWTKDWASRDPDRMKRVGHKLASANVSMDEVWAHTMVANLTAIGSLDRMTLHAEMRRNAVLREIERHRVSFGKALRQASEIEDAEFEEINKAEIEDKKAA
jgi:hypothetical protein